MVRLTRIYTRGGDKGETSLGDGRAGYTRDNLADLSGIMEDFGRALPRDVNSRPPKEFANTAVTLRAMAIMAQEGCTSPVVASGTPDTPVPLSDCLKLAPSSCWERLRPAPLSSGKRTFCGIIHRWRRRL